jgi:predicted nucleotide-binding protein
MTASDFTPYVIAATRNPARILITGNEGIERVLQRQSWEAYFQYARRPHGPSARLTVVLPNTVRGVELTAFDLPAIPDQNEKMWYLAEAAIGEYLDKHGLPPVPSGEDSSAFVIQCTTDQLQEWASRDRASEQAAFEYIQRKAYAARDFESDYTALGYPDFIRLHVTLNRLRQVAERGDGVYWRFVAMMGGFKAIVLQVLPGIAELQQQATADRPSSGLSPSVRDDLESGSRGKRVFVVHGHDLRRLQQVETFLRRIELSPVILHQQVNAGQTIIEKIESNSDVAFAVVLLTPDDVGTARKGLEEANDAQTRSLLRPRARQNVILELGYFIALLGRKYVCALYDEGVEIPSDYQGVLFVPLDQQGDWERLLARELEAAALEINMRKV